MKASTTARWFALSVFAGFSFLGTAACSNTGGSPSEAERTNGNGHAGEPKLVPAPLKVEKPAEAADTLVKLPANPPQEMPGLHNVVKLSDRIIIGAEPEGPEAFMSLVKMGVKTIISVDGKTPDAEAAAKHGLRYVHIPIGYDGITEEERLKLAKTYRELPGPVYTHCFHGKHRGPAAAAVGRVAVDGAPRDQAIAEMSQWCGTGKAYTGLYEVIALGDLPEASATKQLDYNFAPAAAIGGLQSAMVVVARAEEGLKALSKQGWKADAHHPDLVAIEEAKRAADTFTSIMQQADYAGRPADYKQWMERSEETSKELVLVLEKVERGDPEASDQAVKLYQRLKADCNACHKSYRD